MKYITDKCSEKKILLFVIMSTAMNLFELRAIMNQKTAIIWYENWQ
jgi:hypothetical protein